LFKKILKLKKYILPFTIEKQILENNDDATDIVQIVDILEFLKIHKNRKKRTSNAG